MTEVEDPEEEASEVDYDELPLDEKLFFQTRRYLTDLGCLKEMFESVIPVLESQDEERAEKIEEIFDEAEEGPDDETIILSGDKLRSFQISAERLARAQILFRMNSIVAIVARYEQFMRQLLTIYYKENLNKLKGESIKLDSEEILEGSSYEQIVNEMLKKLIEDDIMGDSHPKQVNFINNKLSLGIKEYFSRWKDFIEITLRRNMYVHNGPKVNSIYLNRCNQHDIDVESLEQGDLLYVSEDYFNKAFLCFFELGLRLGESAFRRIFEDEEEKLELADSRLQRLGYRFLKAQDWDVAELIFGYAMDLKDKHVAWNQEMYYTVLVNYCLARKKNEKRFIDILEERSWGQLKGKFSLNP